MAASKLKNVLKKVRGGKKLTTADKAVLRKLLVRARRAKKRLAGGK
jgi:hypothetical protein